MTTAPLTFQQALMRLQQYWAEHGCIIWQPYSEKVGAGTMNPATVLRVLGPEPWNVGYIEPSYRPADGRYAENPNRMQMHTQYQVILKPEPGNPQELYLASLEAIGIDRKHHDIRFVEDNWESPALGAWGLGWEVWLDGMEITQYTYFQQAGGIELNPVCVELTYGMERIAMFLQSVNSVWKIQWDDNLTYGDILKINEVEHCTYNFDVADVERLTTLYNLYEEEAENCLSKGLVIPAHDFVLRCSHTFNILDARGAVGVTERARFFARMRTLARQVAQRYVEQREEAGHPMLRPLPATVHPAATPAVPPAEPADLLFEIGTEELPADDLWDALQQLETIVPRQLDAARLPYRSVRVTGTPRRLAIYVQGLAPRQPDEERLIKGPPAQTAFDSEGRPTKAARGFAAGQGATVDDLEVRDIEGRQYAVLAQRLEGRPVTEVLPEVLPAIIADLHFQRSMRWNASNVAFSRPIRWLVGLLGNQALDFSYADVYAGRESRGLRPEGSPPVVIPEAGRYFDVMREQNIVVDAQERRQQIREQAAKVAAEVGGHIPDVPDLLDEVTNLVETPTAIRGTFEEKYLALPQEVLITVMRKHQRYFPVVDGKGKMMPYFVTIANGEVRYPETVIRGNEGVLRARYADADFFYAQDTTKPLADYVPALRGLTFQEALGSMLDKTGRMEKLLPWLADQLGLDDAEHTVTARATHLCKADLVTNMVIELTSLQGYMGREYARKSGEAPQVAEAILEHYLPKHADDALPASRPGMAVSLLNRLDSLTGLFAVGLAPSGSADPYALRRQANGLVQILAQKGIDLSLTEALQQAVALQPVSVSDERLAAVFDFIRGRFRAWLIDSGYRHDLVDAVLAVHADNPARAYRTLNDLAAWVERPEWAGILTAYSRPARIVRGQKLAFTLSETLLAEPAEQALYAAYETARQAIDPHPTVARFCEAFEGLVAPINAFFEDVFVMVDDKATRENRLALLQNIAGLASNLADLSKVRGF